MSENQPHTLICSVLFLDIEGYSKRSVAEQLAIKQRFNELLVGALRHVATDDRIILDTGDGAAVGFLSEPEDSLFAAMNLRDAIAAKDPALRVRIGINLGPVRLLKDINGQVNIIGDGINDAQRVMSFAEPGRILVSRSYYEVISRLSDDYARLFVYDGTRTDKHVREHAVYAIGESIPEPAHDFTARIEAAQAPPQATQPPQPSSSAPPVVAPVAEMPAAKGRSWIAAAAVAALLLVGIGTAWLWRGNAAKQVAAPPPEKPVERTVAPTVTPEPPKAVVPEKPVERKDAAPRGTQPQKPSEPKKEAKQEAKPAANWLVEMRNELAVCRQQGIIKLGICMERVRWKYCAPSHWDTVEECSTSKSGKTAGP